MKRIPGLVLLCAFVFAALSSVAAQEMQGAGTMPPPKVLVLFREFLKPGKGGEPHEKAESAFVQAFTKSKWPTHYLAVGSLSGRPRALFLTGYDSFADWEKDNKAVEKNSMLSAALDRASVADGELLSDADGSVMVYREDQSLRANVDIAHMRYFEISLYQVRPGHRRDWDEAVKLVKAAYEKIPDAHWATYQLVYSQQPGSTYVIFTALKSASEIDDSFMRDKDFVAAMGEDGMKKLAELEDKAIESVQNNLFMFNPKMSYVSEEWIKADPDFWKPRVTTTAAPKKPEKAAEKPAGQ